jgi:DNA-directed RNA polymerase specialized sigma24 family protein
LVYGRPAGGPVEDPDLDLVRRAGAGDGPACAALVDRHLARITALAGRMLGNRADAEDGARAEVFLRVCAAGGLRAARSGGAVSTRPTASRAQPMP